MNEISQENQISQKQLLNQLKENIEEINNLKEKIESLEQKIVSLNNKIFDLKIKNKILNEIDAKNKGILEDKKLCENKIEQLKSEILNVSRKEKSEKRLIESELQNEVLFYRGLHESGLGKVHAAERIINLNNFQNDYIQHLEKEIQKLRNNNDETISKLKLEHDIHFYNLKQKMAKYVKDIHHTAAAKYKDNLEYSSKLNILYKNQMLNELEREALLIKELIISKEKYEKQIFILNQDLIFQKEVHKDLQEKNIKYMNIIKNINKKYPNTLNLNNDIFSNKTTPLSKKKKKKFKTINTIKINEENENIKDIQEKIVKNIINNNIYRECITNKNYNNDKKNHKNYFDEYISLNKLYEELYKENKDIKEQLITLKDKQKMIYNKFNGILNLYNDALKLIINEEDLKINNISLNKEIIEQGNYEKLTPWQKYIIVMLLIKHLLPLIKTSIDDKDELNTINNYNFNYRSIFDKRIDICDSNFFDFSNRKLRNNLSIKSFNSDTDINSKKINTMFKNKLFNRNKRLKIFKAIKGKYKPIRFIHIENKFNFNIKSEKDISLTKNNFFE